MSTVHDTTASVRAAQRLRAEVERLESNTRRRSPLRRLAAYVAAALLVTTLGVLAVDAWLAYDVFWRDGSGRTRAAAEDEPSYSGLVVRDVAGDFGGQVEITNPLDRDLKVWVTVDVYDGDQHLGELYGDVTLKPSSTSKVDLSGVDEYQSYTDSRVHLTGWPLGQPGTPAS